MNTKPWLWAAWLGLSACGPIGRDALWSRPGAGDDAGQTDAAQCAVEAPELPPPPAVPTPDPARAAAVHHYFELRVQDQDGAPVVGASLRTTNHISLRSDVHGKAAFYEPQLMGLDVYFFVEREGYELAADGFGYRGKALRVDEGGAGVITMQRSANPAPPSESSDRESRLLEGPVREGDACFGIRVIDQATKRGVPLVFLESADAQLVTDSQGIAAYCDPDHMGQELRFAVQSHGYAFAAGEIALSVQPGTIALLELTRLNLAERLYRSTGQGIYRESQRLGLSAPNGDTALNGRVMQQDAVSAAEHDGKLFWLWGNTDRPGYPLGNFWGSAASSALPEASDPALGPSFDYLLGDDKTARPMGQSLPPSNLSSWLSSLVSLPDAAGNAQLFAVYGKPRSDLSLAARGLARLAGETMTFQSLGVDYPLTDFVGPRGQPVRVRHGADEYVYFAPPLRVKARAESLLDPQSYELFTAYGAAQSSQLSRDERGNLRYAFRQDARATTAKSVAAAGLDAAQSLEGHFADAQSGAAIQAAGDGATAFSRRHQRFVHIFQQLGGISSFAGEIWYAEADTPLGPWVYARKILSHDRYTFYSPWLHPYFEQGDGRLLYFEGSYTTALAGEGIEATPRYERNQIMYRLDLDDPRLALPVPVYDVDVTDRADLVTRRGIAPGSAARAALFFAPEQAAPDTQAVYWSGPACGPRRLLLGPEPRTPALFYAYAPDASARPAQLVPLYEFSDEAGARAYAPSETLAGFTRRAEPLAYVWPSPIAVALPVGDFAARLWADAGPDQCLREDQPGRGAFVRLDAAGSHSEDGPIEHYAWYLDGDACPSAEAETATTRLSVGVHTLTLRVRDRAGNLASDSMLLEVAAHGSARAQNLAANE